MTFNINEFKSTLDRHGGLARPNLFTVEFTGNSQNRIWNNSSFGNRDFKFFCQTATFPGMSVNTFDYRPNNIDVAQSIPFSIGQQQVECVFMVDDHYGVLNYLHSWMRQVINFSTGGIPGAAIALPGTENTSSQQFPYEIGYKKEYVQMMTITMYSRHPSSTTTGNVDEAGTIAYDNKYVCRLYDVYPVQIGSLALEWGANDSYSTVPVSFSYSAFDMSVYSNGVETIGPGIPI